MDSTDFDIPAPGGGPGGGCQAAVARLRGLSACPAEKGGSARFDAGEGPLTMGKTVPRSAGARPRAESAGFVRKYGAEFMLGDGSEAKEIVFAGGCVCGPGAPIQVLLEVCRTRKFLPTAGRIDHSARVSLRAS